MEFLVFHQPSRPEAVIWTKAEQLPPHVPSAASGRGSSSPDFLGDVFPSSYVVQSFIHFPPPYKKSAAHFRELRY